MVFHDFVSALWDHAVAAARFLVTLWIGRAAGEITPPSSPPNRRPPGLLGLPASALSLSPLRAYPRASACHASLWAHGRVAFTASRAKPAPLRGFGFHPRFAPSSPMGLSSALRLVTLRRLRNARLPSVSGLEQIRFASLRFRALAPVHPRCSARLHASL